LSDFNLQPAKDKIIYADNAATTSVAPAVLESMLPFLTKRFGNASSIYSLGVQSREAVEKSRNTIARCLNAEPSEIYFTSGGTESDNWAIRSAFKINLNKKHAVSSKIEHHAVLHSFKALEKEGLRVSYLGVDSNGLVDVKEFSQTVREDTSFASIMMANNEIGTIEPVKELSVICKEHGVLFHTDAVQAVGHVKVDVKELGVDMLSFSAHKFHGPKGIGGIFIRKGINLLPFMEGGAQENKMRAGTENVAGIVGMAKALEIATQNMTSNNKKVTQMRNHLIKSLLGIDRSRLNGDPVIRLPGNANFCFEGIEGESLILNLDLNGICASSGSACTSGSLEPSHVLLALGISHSVAHGSLRITLCEENTLQEVNFIIQKVKETVEKLRLMSPVWEKIKTMESAGFG
jgi:cysteine desulfurase